MAKFEDTPKWRRAREWDPAAGRMVVRVEPPTRRQLEYLRALCGRAGVVFVAPASRREAMERIAGLRGRSRKPRPVGGRGRKVGRRSTPVAKRPGKGALARDLAAMKRRNAERRDGER